MLPRFRLALAVLALASLTFAGAALAPQVARATQGDAPPPGRILSVQGRATVEAAPDAARLRLGVSVTRPTAGEAYQQATATVQQVVAALRRAGVADRDLQTADLTLVPEYRWDKEAEQQKLVGYRAQATLTVTTRDLARAGALADAAVGAGANLVHGIEFFVWDAGALKQQALERAADDARAKADRLAARFGTAVTGVARIQVLDGDANPPPPVVRAMPASVPVAQAEAEVLPGTLRWQVTVSVDFTLR